MYVAEIAARNMVFTVLDVRLLTSDSATCVDERTLQSQKHGTGAIF